MTKIVGGSFRPKGPGDLVLDRRQALQEGDPAPPALRDHFSPGE
jgi:hypothetical protein